LKPKKRLIAALPIPVSKPAKSEVLKTRRLNELVDRALIDPSDAHIRNLLGLDSPAGPSSLAERVRRRATLLARKEPADWKAILDARDAIVAAAYAATVPTGWLCGWCDGSSIRVRSRRLAGAGAILMEANGTFIAHLAQPAGELNPFEAEVFGLHLLLRMALDHNVEKIRIHTDCTALLTLWYERGRDPRATQAWRIANAFHAVNLRVVPRAHNHPAHVLAKNAALARILHQSVRGLPARN
jgi:ribonuclease HI